MTRRPGLAPVFLMSASLAVGCSSSPAEDTDGGHGASTSTSGGASTGSSSSKGSGGSSAASSGSATSTGAASTGGSNSSGSSGSSASSSGASTSGARDAGAVVDAAARDAQTDASTQDAQTAPVGPCDIYASDATPCVAAHSTVRALYGAYDGNLYQVRRASDRTTSNITVLTPGGFADAAAQDAFCAGTTCTISIIYDQSPRANHLTSAPGGGHVPAPDTEASATGLKLTVGGHTVYAVFVNAGNGYRNDKTSGIATADQPETEYMVTSGTHFNGGCCFDYGNAETDNDDDGAGTMEAVYFGNSTGWGRGSGNGPWVMADLENGLFSNAVAAGTNATDTPLALPYVTAMVKGRSGSFALKGSNAQTGSLTTIYDGARPPGYNPMKKQGAILLGIGGDNSNSSAGTFFEGCMTSGNPSDSADNAVQANIVAAGYGR